MDIDGSGNETVVTFSDFSTSQQKKWIGFVSIKIR